jgi:ABC-type sugar transport system substrate-binding protein
LKFVGTQTAAEEPSAQAQAMTALLAKNPKVGTVFTYDDSAAQAAATVARRQRSKVRVFGYAGSAATVDNYIKKGSMYATICIDLTGLGVNLANAAINQIQGKELPKQLMTKNKLLTAENADSAAQVGCS